MNAKEYSKIIYKMNNRRIDIDNELDVISTQEDNVASIFLHANSIISSILNQWEKKKDSYLLMKHLHGEMQTEEKAIRKALQERKANIASEKHSLYKEEELLTLQWQEEHSHG